MEEENNLVNEKISSKYVLLVLLAGILTLLPVHILVLKVLGLHSYTYESVAMFLFYVFKIAGFLIYFKVLNENIKGKKVLAIISGIALVISVLMVYDMDHMENKGLDYIGEALALAMFFKLSTYVYYGCAFIIFVLHAKKFIFNKEVITKLLIAILLIVAVVFIGKEIIKASKTEKVDKSLKSVSDFKQELIERNLYQENDFIFGVDNKEGNIHKVDIENDLEKRYPSYIYCCYDLENKNENINPNNKYLLWIIYYTNGKMYAALVDQYINSSPNTFTVYSNILTDDDEIYTYNMKDNYYEKIDIEKDGVILNNLKYTSILIDYPEKTTYGYLEYITEKFEIVDRIDSEFLDYYANNLKEKK